MRIQTSAEEIEYLKELNEELIITIKASAKFVKYWIYNETGHGNSCQEGIDYLRWAKEKIKQSERGYK